MTQPLAAVRRSLALTCLATFAAACGGGGASNPGPTAPKELGAQSSAAAKSSEGKASQKYTPPSMCLARERITTLLAEGPLPPVPPDNVNARLASLSSTGAKDADARDLYSKVAPATVLIRAGDGMGTGVIIDPSGWVLTAYHVVRDAKSEDFTIKVSVEIGSLGKDGPTKGLMQRSEKRYEAVVHKADPVRDLAVLKITDPPPNLPSVKIAKDDVRPSDPITVVGHAGVGLLWGVKSGTVSTAGELGKNLASLVLLECKADMPKEECDKRKKMHDQAQADLATMPAGMLIQSTVATTRGDSGGPVVNAAGQLVGIVSFSNSDHATGVAYSYHVHGSEIRQFAAEIPKKPAQITPNPWCDGGFDATLEDIDLDGQMDTLISSQYAFGDYSPVLSRRAIMIDLDQDNFTKKSAKSDAPFDAEIVILYVDGKHYAYYDTDNDGRFDELLIDDKGLGSPNVAWKIEADGTMTKDDASKWRNDLRAEAFADKAMRERLSRIAPVVFPRWILESGKETTASLPDPISGGGKKGRLLDLDRDGRPDAVLLNASFSQGVLLDGDQKSLGSLNIDDNPQALLNARSVHGDFSLVEQGAHRWAYYDTNKDGKFDLALAAQGDELVLGIASAAWRLDPNGKRTEASEFVGRKLIRPGLLSGSEASRLRGLGRMYPIAADEGLGSVPSPTQSLRMSDAYFVDLKGWPHAVAVNESPLSRAILIDVDRSTKFDPKERQPDVARALATGQFDAEYAEFQYAGMMWGFYDTDDDGTFDLVLFTANPRAAQVQRAYRLGADGKLTVDPSAVAGKWIRPGLFAKKPIGAQLKKLAKDLFKPEFVDE